MKKAFTYITKGSKLIVIYILTVLVSGSILTYLSINNISNFEELTEKRITEEEKGIVENYRIQFQSVLEALADSIEKSIPKNGVNYQEENFQTENKLISNYLIMNKDGVLTRPHFIHSSIGNLKNNTSPYFLQKFKQAESAEFIHKDYIKSENWYLSSLNFAKSASDSAKVFNAVARIYVKTGDQKRAFGLYKKLITSFNQTLNDFGFPYAYFSLDQLMTLTNANINQDKNEILIFFLYRLLNNTIPYNNSTSDLVKKIHSEAEQIDDATTQQLVKTLCNKINIKIATIVDYKETMEAVVSNRVMDSLLQLKNFLVLTNENSNNEIMLLQQLPENSIGYTIRLNKIDSIVSEKITTLTGKFDYTIQLTDAGLNGPFYGKKMAIKNNFSPFFNKKIIEVQLKDPAIVKKYVFNRKITTAIGLFLLLAAMLIGLFTLMQDVTRKKRMAKMRADFISNVTHELKTPLTSINMFADSIVLDRVKKEKDIKKYANIIVKESEKLKRMINNILDFSRKENDKLTYHLKEEDLSEIVRDIIDEMNYWLEINNFEIHLDLEENLLVNVDKEGLKQVLSNLITNAIKYSPKEKKIAIRTYNKLNTAFIEVEDHGTGIAEDKLQSIFEKFYRINSKKNENISGTGLGLTVSKDIIEAQDGKLLVSSTLNEGSKFTIVLNI